MNVNALVRSLFAPRTARWIAERSATLLALGVILLSGCSGSDESNSGDTQRDLVFIVPGTYASDASWPTVAPGRVSFASELMRGLDQPGKDYPTVWHSSIWHDKRAEGAANLAAKIDEQSSAYDRVCIIGHSHGGNIALMAAGQCRTPIDTIICLSTPHPHLATRTHDGENLYLPIYCSPQTVDNVKTLVTISPTTDNVPDKWSNWLWTGLDDNQGEHLSRGWAEASGHPRLQRDSFLMRLFEQDNIVATKQLSINGSIHIEVDSLVRDGLGVKAHQMVHSRRMGYLIGELLRDGPSSDRLDYVARFVQPADADDGEPIALAEHQRKLELRTPHYDHVGWRLDDVSIQLDRASTANADQLPLPSLPDPILRIHSGDGLQLWGQSASAENAYVLQDQPRLFVYRDRPYKLGVYDVDGEVSLLGNKLGGLHFQSLGEHTFDGRQTPPTSLSTVPAQDIRWSGSFLWTAVHH